MEEILNEIKKTGNKINSLSRKIEEATNLSLQNKVYTYFEELEKSKNKLSELIEKLKSLL